MADINDLLDKKSPITSEGSSPAAPDSSGSGLTVFVVVFALAGLVFLIFGIQNLYDDSYSRQVVGGDAYNFVIYGTRGTAWVCGGIIMELIAIVFALYATRR
jgi:hypothetical protein